MAKKAKKTVTKRPAAKKTAKKAVTKSAKASVKKATPKKAARRIVKKAPRPSGSALLNIAPGFTANDAAATVAWYCDVLGFTIVERWEHDGVFHGAQVASGGVVVNIGQDDWKKGRDRVKGLATRMYITMGRDIDKYAAAIKARGGTLVREPADGSGARFFEISDPDGFQITFIASGKR